MAEWVLIENNEIKEYHDLLPKNWKIYSGLDLSKDNLEFLKSLGWYKVQKIKVDYNNEYDQLLGYIYEITDDCVLEKPNIKYGTIEEKISRDIENEKNALEQLRTMRNKLLKDSDWTQCLDIKDLHSEEWLAAWKSYRQQLRDLPSRYVFNETVPWPESPNGI